VQRASELQRFEIFVERHALSIAFETFLIYRLEPEEHGVQTEPFPKFEHLLIAQQHIAARFEVITFPDAAARNRFSYLHTVLGLDERYVIHDENAGLADLRQLFDSALWCFYAVVASVERPRAAKYAVPRATSAEFDGSGRIELADEIFPAMSRQMSSR